MIINEGDYDKHQIFIVDEIASYWNRMPLRTSIAREEKSVPSQCFKASGDRLTILLGANAVGNFKLKTVLSYHFENTRTLKNYDKSTVPVLCKWNNKACLTAICLQHGLLNILNPLRLTAQKKRDSFQIITAPGQCTWLLKSCDDDLQQSECCFHTC